MPEKRNKPLEQVRVGNVLGSIWAHKSARGEYFRFKLSRFYQKQGEERWSYTESLRPIDLEDAARACKEARARIAVLETERTKEQKNEPARQPERPIDME